MTRHLTAVNGGAPRSHVTIRPNTAELPTRMIEVTTLELSLIVAALGASSSQACRDLAARLSTHRHPSWQDPDPTPARGTRRPGA